VTLRCGCGGVVEITSATYGDERMIERYECAACGRTGTFSSGPPGERTTGCVVRS